MNTTSEYYSISWGSFTDAILPDASRDVCLKLVEDVVEYFSLFVQHYWKIYLLLEHKFTLEDWRM